MNQQPALFGERLLTLDGCVRGIVAVRTDERGKKLYTLQCENCLATEEPEHLVFMTFKFHTRHQGDNPRLCRECRVAAYSDGCTCDGCKEDLGRSLYA